MKWSNRLKINNKNTKFYFLILLIFNLYSVVSSFYSQLGEKFIIVGKLYIGMDTFNYIFRHLYLVIPNNVKRYLFID